MKIQPSKHNVLIKIFSHIVVSLFIIELINNEKDGKNIKEVPKQIKNIAFSISTIPPFSLLHEFHNNDIFHHSDMYKYH